MPRLLLSLLLLLLPLAAMGAGSAEPPRVLSPEDVILTPDQGVTQKLLPELRAAMAEELEARLASERETTAQLVEEWKSAPSPQSRLAIEQRIQKARQAGWLDLMRIQAKYLRLDGHVALAETIEAKIDAVENPAPRNADVRPVVDRQPSTPDREVQQ